MAPPMPPEAPVTSAVWPVRSNIASAPNRHSGAPWRICDAPPDRRTHACAERGGEPGIHIPEAVVPGFRTSPFGRSRNDELESDRTTWPLQPLHQRFDLRGGADRDGRER